MSHSFPHFHQHDSMDCGATCLRMIAKYYGKNYSLETLRERTYITREGDTTIENEKLKIENDKKSEQLSTFNFQLKIADPAQGLIKYTLEVE